MERRETVEWARISLRGYRSVWGLDCDGDAPLSMYSMSPMVNLCDVRFTRICLKRHLKNRVFLVRAEERD